MSTTLWSVNVRNEFFEGIKHTLHYINTSVLPTFKSRGYYLTIEQINRMFVHRSLTLPGYFNEKLSDISPSLPPFEIKRYRMSYAEDADHISSCLPDLNTYIWKLPTEVTELVMTDEGVQVEPEQYRKLVLNVGRREVTNDELQYFRMCRKLAEEINELKVRESKLGGQLLKNALYVKIDMALMTTEEMTRIYDGIWVPDAYKCRDDLPELQREINPIVHITGMQTTE